MDNFNVINSNANYVMTTQSDQSKENILHMSNDLDGNKISEHNINWTSNINCRIYNDSSSESQINHFNEEIPWLDQITEETCPVGNLIQKPYKTPVSLKSRNRTKLDVKLKDQEEIEDGDKLKSEVNDVRSKLSKGCECHISCYRALKPEAVYNHRLNIAKLSKSEHDMYLMGVTMASICDPTETSRHKERRRLRASYVYQGRRVCLDAFLYLENVTHYQLKRIRKHVMMHGVTPRIHGNIGKKPYNSFNLNTYQNATNFIKRYIETNFGVKDSLEQTLIIQGETQKNVYDHYLENGKSADPYVKLMGYSTFRHFIKEQFPSIKFTKLDKKENYKLDNNTLREVTSLNKTKENLELSQQGVSDIQAMPIVVVEDKIEFVMTQVPSHIF